MGKILTLPQREFVNTFDENLLAKIEREAELFSAAQNRICGKFGMVGAKYSKSFAAGFVAGWLKVLSFDELNSFIADYDFTQMRIYNMFANGFAAGLNAAHELNLKEALREAVEKTAGWL